MRILIPLGAIAAIGWLIGRPEWQHASHAKQAGAVLALAAVFAALEILVRFAASRKPRKRPASPYARSR